VVAAAEARQGNWRQGGAAGGAADPAKQQALVERRQKDELIGRIEAAYKSRGQVKVDKVVPVFCLPPPIVHSQPLGGGMGCTNAQCDRGTFLTLSPFHVLFVIVKFNVCCLCTLFCFVSLGPTVWTRCLELGSTAKAPCGKKKKERHVCLLVHLSGFLLLSHLGMSLVLNYSDF
jgi:hypothetical protein